MSQSGQKLKDLKASKTLTHFFVTIEYKVAKTSENVDWGGFNKVMSSFFKSSVLTVHRKTRKVHFQKFPLWRRFRSPFSPNTCGWKANPRIKSCIFKRKQTHADDARVLLQRVNRLITHFSINTQVIIQNRVLSLARYLGSSADNHLDGQNGCQ